MPQVDNICIIVTIQIPFMIGVSKFTSINCQLINIKEEKGRKDESSAKTRADLGSHLLRWTAIRLILS